VYLSEQHLRDLRLPIADDAPDVASSAAFADGGQFRIEIPSVEGPAAMRVVMDAAARHGVPVHRVSQGSGIWMLTDDEIAEMVALGREGGIEVVLFVGPRAAWGTGRQSLSSSGAALGGALHGAEGLAAGTDEVLRAVELGVDGVLVADLGHLTVLGQLKSRGALPAGFQLKVSVSFPVANPATARVLEDLGATSLNLPSDLSIGAIAAIRRAVDVPLDMYVESADDFGGAMRHYEIPRLVDAGAPIYLKFTVRNAPNTYPSGQHVQSLVESLSAERVRRAALGLALLRRYRPDARVSPVGVGRPV
jgi:Peptidase family U32